MTFLGIDPGLSGALAAVTEEGVCLGIWDAPTLLVKKSGGGKKNTYIESAMVALLKSCESVNPLITIENVHAMPKQGVTSMFSMGMGFGLWLGIAAALQIPIQRVEPAKWKRDMGLIAKADKNTSIVIATRLFPKAPISVPCRRKRDGSTETFLDGRAEALLIAEWARRQRV